MYRDTTLSKVTYRDYFCRLKDRDFDIDGRPSQVRSKTLENAELEKSLDEDPCQMQEEVTSALRVTHQTISK